MNLPRFALSQPHLIAALAMMVAAMGGFAFWNTPTDLFPDTVPPQVAVVTVKPGATAGDMSDQVTEVLEKELGTISGMRRVTSTSRDEVSSINVEFYYAKPIGEAVVDVQNAVARVQGDLPRGIQQPRLYRISDATRPLVTLALSPRSDSLKRLADIRLLAENELKDEMLAIDGIADVQVFGGHRPELTVRVDREALSAHGLTLAQVLAVVAQQNVSAPAGTIYGNTREYLVNVSGEFASARTLEDLPLKAADDRLIALRDIATVSLEEADPSSLYHGNGRPAIAVNLLRAEDGATTRAIRNFKQALPRLEQRYSDLRFEITDDQQPLIDLNVSGMRSSLVQAVVLTVLVIFFFLSNARAAVTVSAAIPLSFLAALVVLWFSPFTLNMVTLSGLIIAVGMVVDASVVVLENIHRRHAEAPDVDPGQAALTGAGQVALPVTAGMLTTVVVLVPVIFTGGYTGRIMTPLNIMIISTLIASLLISLSVIPVLAAHLLHRPPRDTETGRRSTPPVEKILEPLTTFYIGLVKRALRHRWLFLAVALIFLIFTMRMVKPLLGGEQMPPMDTGIAIVEFDTDASSNPAAVEDVLKRVEEMLQRSPEVRTMSSVVGSEPQAVSFGAGAATSQSAKLTIHLTPRTEREADIWQIEENWREQLRHMSGVRTFRVSEYGATPVSTTKAPFNVILSGPDARVLDRLADQALTRLRGTPGLIDLRRSWYLDKDQQTVDVDPALARVHGTSPEEVATALRTAVQGVAVSDLRLEGYLDIPIRLRYRHDQIDTPQSLGNVDIPTPAGPVKLRNLARVDTERRAPFITREELRPTIDLTAGNQVMTIAQVTQDASQRLHDLPLPAGYTLQLAGSAQDMAHSQAEMGRALVIGLVLLFILLFALFRSFLHPLTIMLSIPLAVAGAMWGLLVFDKPFCMPALMGIILLGGTIVNNAILMLDFIIAARREGMTREDAVIASVQLRLRPILMTATSTIIGFSPLIFEMAVGLERMSPLGIAAASGLLVGTVVTMVYVPLIYVLLDAMKETVKGWLASKRASVVPMILLGLLILPATATRAEQLPQPLTLSAAVAHALEHNPGLAQTRAETRRRGGEAQTVAAARGVLVDLDAQATWSRERHNMVPGLAPGNQGFSHLLYQATLDADVLLTDFGATSSRLEAARRRHNAGHLLTARRADETVFAVANQYLNLLTLRDLEDAAMASLESLLALDRATAQLAQQGRAARVDKLKVEVRLAEVQSRLAELQAAEVSGRHELATLMGSDQQLPRLAEVDKQTVDRMLPDQPAGDEEMILQQREDVRARAAETQAARDQLEAERRDDLPELRLFANTGYYGARDPRGALFDSGSPDEWQNDATIGLKLSVPLLDGGLRSGRIAQARAQADAARARLRELQLGARKELAVARAEQESARTRRATQEKALRLAKETLRLERLKYDAGRGAIRDVLDAEASVLNARGLLHQAERALVIARLAENLALGRLQQTVD